MTVLAAAGDTWGMAGPTFLKIYLVLVVAAVAVTLVLRARALRGGADATNATPTSVEVAYLNRGEGLALHTAVAGLRAAGAVDAGPSGTLVATGRFPAGGGDLDYAVHAALATPATLAAVRGDPGVGNALNRLRDRLTDSGLLVSAERGRAARAAAVALFVVFGLGVTRLVAGIAGHKAVGYLVLADLATLVLCLVLVRVPRLTAAGKALLARLRSANAHLEPKLAPSWATYGPAGAMMGVALYGVASVWASDPAFATQAGIPPVASGGGGWSSPGSGCGTASSCSGGSSCGGGGCGGGGCGG